MNQVPCAHISELRDLAATMVGREPTKDPETGEFHPSTNLVVSGGKTTLNGPYTTAYQRLCKLLGADTLKTIAAKLDLKGGLPKPISIGGGSHDVPCNVFVEVVKAAASDVDLSEEPVTA